MQTTAREQMATVTGAYGHRMQVRLNDGSTHAARTRGRRLKPVCGDRVRCQPISGESEWLIVDIGERRSELARSGRPGKTDVLVANIDCLLVVAAPLPAPDWYVVDRYVAAAAIGGMEAAVVFNKSDADPQPGKTMQALDVYAAAGHEILLTSVVTGLGIDALHDLLAGGTGAFVGQSGVGKSSLVNAMTDEALRVAALSDKWQEGRHTTVNAVMLPVDGGSNIIDSPGVRDFVPAVPSAGEVAQGFREISARSIDCRFSNCLHLREPGCAVQSAVDRGIVSARRYESYRRLLYMTRDATDPGY